MKNRYLLLCLLFVTTLFFVNGKSFGQCEVTIDDENQNTGDEARFISPVFDISGASGASLSFTFAMITFGAYDEFEVSYRTSSSDVWHLLESYSFGDNINFYEESLDLPELTATYQVSFLGRGLGGLYIFLDNIGIVSEGGCARPINLQVDAITTTSALFSWSTSGNEKSWTYELNGVTETIYEQPYQLEGLTPQTDYVFRVKANCSDVNTSEWSMPCYFKTHCDVITVTDDVPYYDDFEASEDFVCWMNDIITGDDGWVVDPGYLVLNNTAFFIWLGGEAMLISAPLDITTVTQPVLNFKHKQRLGVSYGTVDELYVAYRTDETSNWQVLAHFPEATNDWETVTLQLPNPSATYQIAFNGIAHNAEGVYVDDVFVGSGNSVEVTEEEAADLLEGQADVFDLFGRTTRAFPPLKSSKNNNE